MNTIRVCPICLHNKSKLLYTQKFADHFEHKIVSCLLCGFIYVNNIPSQKFYNDYYRDQSKYIGIRQHEMHDVFTNTVFESILKKLIQKKAHILEIGCATGKLLNYIKKKGYTNIKGIEPAPECKDIALKTYDISIITSTLEEYHTHEKFDFIILSAVLEHIVDIRSSIIKIDSLLKDNGIIFICVPDAGRFYKVFNEPFGEFSTEHINFFTQRSLSHLFSKFENIFEKSDSHALVSLWRKEDKNEKRMCKYIILSERKMKKIHKTIQTLPQNTIIWGAGALTQRLLKTTSIKSKIYTFIDSNKNLSGKQLEGIDILSPDKLKEFSNPILISSYGFKDEIMKQIIKMKIKNKIITF